MGWTRVWLWCALPVSWYMGRRRRSREGGRRSGRSATKLPLTPSRRAVTGLGRHWDRRDDATITRRLDLCPPRSHQDRVEAPVVSQPRRAALQTTRQPALVLVQERHCYGWDGISWMQARVEGRGTNERGQGHAWSVYSSPLSQLSDPGLYL